MKYITPLYVFLAFLAVGVIGVAYVEYVFFTKHMFYENAYMYQFAVFPVVGAIAAGLTAYIQRKG